MSANDKPILFSAPMVRAILDGRKTMTRRIVKHPHIVDADIWSRTADEMGRWEFGCASGAPGSYGHGDYVRCPYGAPGDRLWVKETWQYADWTEDGYPYIRCAADDSRRLCERVPSEWSERLSSVWSGLSAPENIAIDGRASDRCWRPSIHMPRWASRITLEVTGVRVERLHAIAGRDVLAEGVDNGKSNPAQGERWENMQRMAFEALWSEINGAESWKANPWVWVVSFKRVEEQLHG